MALGTYTELQAAILAHLGRVGDTAIVAPYLPDLIALGEQRIFFGSADPELPTEPLRIRAMEQFTDPDSYVTVAGEPTLTLPTGWLGFTREKTLELVSGSSRYPLAFVTPQQLVGRFHPADTGMPAAIAIEGENFRFGPAPDAAYGVYVGYYKRFDPLATTPTNWLLQNAPGIYLYAALLEAMPFLKNLEYLPIWARMYAAAVGGLLRSDRMDRWSGPLVARPDAATP